MSWAAATVRSRSAASLSPTPDARASRRAWSCRSTISVDGVGQERHLARPLDRHRHLSLVTPAGPGDPPRPDLALLGHVPPQLVVVLVVDLLDLLLAEVAGLAPGGRACCSAALGAAALGLGLRCHADSLLEGDVVVGGRSAGERDRVGREFGGRAEAGAAALVVTTGAEELDLAGHHLALGALAAVLRLPLAPLEPAVDRHRTALAQVLRAVLALGAPDLDVEVVGLLRPLTRGLVLVAAVHRQPQAAHAGAAGERGELRICGQVAGQDDAIDVCHLRFLLCLFCERVFGYDRRAVGWGSGRRLGRLGLRGRCGR